jgi:TolB protein
MEAIVLEGPPERWDRSGTGGRELARMSASASRRRLRMVVAVGAIALAAMWLAPPAQAAYPGKNGRISFSAPDARGFSHIYTMAANGGDVRQLTHSPRGFDDYASDWSPDGQWIAFDRTSEASGQSEIQVIRPDGNDARQVTHLNGHNYDPSWSPDGETLVFEHLPPCTCTSNIYTIRPDGSGLHQLTHFDHNTEAEEPELSPDGQWIVFQQTPRVHPPYAVYLMRSDGSDLHRITPLAMDAGHPGWSPDGSKIIFNDHVSKSVGDIFTIRPDGTGLTQLTDVARDGIDYFHPDYAPNGKHILFEEYSSEHPFAILVMNAKGKGAHVITGSNALLPDWGPRNKGA